MAEADLIGEDPCTLAESAARLSLSKEFTQASYDYGLEEQKKLLDIKFVQNDTATKRTSTLTALKGHVASSTNKLLKLFGNLHVSEQQAAKITKALDDQHTLLTDKGIFNENFDGTQLFQTVDEHTNDLNNFKVKLAGQDFESIRQIIPRFRTIEEKLGDVNIITIDKTMRTHHTQLEKLAPLTVGDAAQTLVDNSLVLEPLLPHVNELLQLSQKVYALETAPTIQQTAIEEINQKVEAVAKVLTEIKQLKVAIDKTPAAQSTVRSQFGAAKIPELISLEPSEFKTWRGRFLALADLQTWTDEHKKTALTLAVPDAKVFIPLKLSTPNWDELSAAQIIEQWEKRCCPDSYRDLANANLSQLHQGMEEASNAYIDRATELYIAARFDLHGQDPETDQQFILRLINSFRDSRLRAPLRRRKPKTLSELRLALNEEVNIIDNDPMASNANLAAIGPNATGNRFDNKNAKASQQKNQPIRCNICKDSHIAEKCPLVFGIITAYEKSQKQKNKSQQDDNQSQNNKGKGDNRGRGGRGRGGGRGGRGDRSRGKFRYPNEQPQGQGEGEPPQKAQKFEKFHNEKN